MLNQDFFSSRLNQFGASPRARLRGLTLLLMQWNRERLDEQQVAPRQDLTQQDVEVLKQLIHTETRKLNSQQADVLAEQILFFILGEIGRAHV